MNYLKRIRMDDHSLIMGIAAWSLPDPEE